jgi:hypothetical protein
VSSAHSASSGLHQSLYCQWYRPKGFSMQPPTPACRRVKIGRSEALSPVSCPAIPALILAIRQLRVCAASTTTNLGVGRSNPSGPLIERHRLRRRPELSGSDLCLAGEGRGRRQLHADLVTPYRRMIQRDRCALPLPRRGLSRAYGTTAQKRKGE